MAPTATTSSSSSTSMQDAMRAAFETAVRKHSTRRHDMSYDISYYISYRLLQVLAARLAAQRGSTPIKDASLQCVVLLDGNARLFKRTSLELHVRVENVVLADSDVQRPDRLSASELKRLTMLVQHAHKPAFCRRLKRLQNGGDELLASIHQLLASLTDRYTRPSSCSSRAVSTDSAFERCDSDRDDSSVLTHFEVHVPQAVSALAPAHLPTAQASLRPICTPFPLCQVPNATIHSLRSDTSPQRALAIYQRDPHQFNAFRIFFANDSTALATAIARRCCDKRTKQAVCDWISASIGSIPSLACKEFETHELRWLALVAAALTIYGEHVLSALYAFDSSMGGVNDIPLVADELRVARQQRWCLQRARWTGKRPVAGDRLLHAAHYLPLDVTIQWNNALPPTVRLGTKALGWILNDPSNLRAVPRRVNLRDHRTVEHLLAMFIRSDCEPAHCKLQRMTWLAGRNVRDRLAFIAARVQAPAMRDALLRADGLALFELIRTTFEAIECAFAARGWDFGPIWQQPATDCATDNLVIGSTMREMPTSGNNEL